MNWLVTWIEGAGSWAPAGFAALFIAASFLMIWRLESMSEGGLEGTVLGTLIMPYCSGIGNLLFALIVGKHGGSGSEVMTNALVNNVTNLTLLIGLPAGIWGLNLLPVPVKSKKKKRDHSTEHKINRLSLLLTLIAVFVFTGAVWALARDGGINFNDGLVLVGLFLFWQTFHVFDVLKSNVRQNRSFNWMLPVDLALLGLGAWATYISIDWLVAWLPQHGSGFISAKNLGWLSGWMMVLPNGLLAMYYGWRGQADVVYTSQVGDGHICIPLCIGVFALYHNFPVPAVFQTGMLLIFASTAAHVLLVLLFGGVPRVLGWTLVAAYGVFLYQGLIR